VNESSGTALRVLSRAAGLNLRSYRDGHVAECVRRAVEREGLADEMGLARLLRHDAAARTRFRRSVAVSVSGLFRHPAQFEILEHELLPTLLAEQRRLTVWAAGCADGSELYSVAILLERLGALDRAFLLGSDVLEENLALARQGVYGSERMSDELRVKLRWEQRDIVSDGPPEGSWRLILCRNLAIYLAAEAKDSLHQRLAAALAPGGVLMLGRSERLSNPRTLGLEASGAHVYRRLR
jgi:chemotaxis protein methyltransferase CheR